MRHMEVLASSTDGKVKVLIPPTSGEIHIIEKVVASRLPATDSGEILPRVSRIFYEEASIMFLSVRMGNKDEGERIMALLRTLVPQELWHYYNILPHLALWLERWVYGFVGPSPMDKFAPLGMGRMFWLFSPFPRRLLERGYLYGLSFQPGIPPKHAQTLRQVSLLPPEELTRFKKASWRHYALYTKMPNRLLALPQGGTPTDDPIL